MSATLEESLDISYKAKHSLTKSAIQQSHWHVYPTDGRLGPKCLWKFLFHNCQKLSKPRDPSVDECMNFSISIAWNIFHQSKRIIYQVTWIYGWVLNVCGWVGDYVLWLQLYYTIKKGKTKDTVKIVVSSDWGGGSGLSRWIQKNS